MLSLGVCEQVEKAPAEYGGDRKTTVVYTDGSCFSNGKPNASAGVGKR